MKIIYNDLIPLKGFTAMNLFGIVFARKEYKPLDDKTFRHESIHSRQWLECSAAGAILALAVSFLLPSFWLILVPALAFPAFYVVEWIVRIFQYGIPKAYENISFEREAYAHDSAPDYLKGRWWFSWTKYL